MRTAVCTIVQKKELAHARVLMQSLREFHPEWEPHVLLADRSEGYFNPERESFRVVEATHLPFPDKQNTLFYYEPTELEAAMKPWVLGWLLDTRGFDRVVFLASRAWLKAPLDELLGALDSGAPLALTPRILGEVRDARSPGEWDVLRWGVHDTGVLAISRNANSTRELLSWWQTRSHRHFHPSPLAGGCGDERWLDLAAARWPVAIVRDPACNVAYWNLGEREVARVGGQYRVKGKPLSLFQFAGFDPQAPERLSPADGRFGRDLPEPVRSLSSEYVKALGSAGHRTCRTWPFAYGRYASGETVCPPARALYRNDEATRLACGEDPFRMGPGPFNHPLNGQACVTRLMGEIWRSRPDLQREFPDLNGRDARRFASWFVTTADRECEVGEAHIGIVRKALERTRDSERPAPAHSKTGRSFSIPTVTRALRFPRLSGVIRDGAPRESIRRLVGKLPGILDIRANAKTIFARAVSGERFTEARQLATPPPRSSFGLNITGYVTADLGVGQSARAAALAAEAAGIDYSMVDFAMGTISPKTDQSYAHKISVRNDHAVNLVHVNADQFPSFRKAIGPEFFEGKRTIGYWAWELPELPDEWIGSFAGLTEVWVPSRFVQTAVSEKSPVPVVVMPHPIVVPKAVPSRARFGLPERGFLFLAMYDLLSYQERKNPAAIISAFRMAFAGRTDAVLVVKVLNAEKCPADMQALRRSLQDLPGAVLLASTLSRQDTYDLEATCDAFVSLHRAEGFGLALAECMYLGKPVIGTNWSGNTDYMTTRNSFPVDYDLVELDRDHGPYKKGQKWADPDIEHAARTMGALVEDPALVARIGAQARATMSADYSPLAIGRRYRARLDRIRGLTPEEPHGNH